MIFNGLLYYYYWKQAQLLLMLVINSVLEGHLMIRSISSALQNEKKDLKTDAIWKHWRLMFQLCNDSRFEGTDVSYGLRLTNKWFWCAAKNVTEGLKHCCLASYWNSSVKNRADDGFLWVGQMIEDRLMLLHWSINQLQFVPTQQLFGTSRLPLHLWEVIVKL